MQNEAFKEYLLRFLTPVMPWCKLSSLLLWEELCCSAMPPPLYLPLPSLSLLPVEAVSGPCKSSSHIVSSVSEAGRGPVGFRRSSSGGFILTAATCPSWGFWAKVYSIEDATVVKLRVCIQTWILQWDLRFLLLIENIVCVDVESSLWGSKWVTSMDCTPHSSSLDNSSDAPNPHFLFCWKNATIKKIGLKRNGYYYHVISCKITSTSRFFLVSIVSSSTWLSPVCISSDFLWFLLFLGLSKFRTGKIM